MFFEMPALSDSPYNDFFVNDYVPTVSLASVNLLLHTADRRLASAQQLEAQFELVQAQIRHQRSLDAAHIDVVGHHPIEDTVYSLTIPHRAWIWDQMCTNVPAMILHCPRCKHE